MIVRNTRTVRAALLASAAGFCLAAGAAQAASEDAIAEAVSRPLLSEATREAQSSRISPDGVVREAQADRTQVADTWREAQLNGPHVPASDPEPQIVIANPPPGPGQVQNTPTTARDPVVITGVGQMVVDAGGGFVGLCTGTLINPRTVIFAAHCVNDEAATNYGAGSGGQGIGFGFSNQNNTTIAGRPAGTSPLRDWLLPGPGQYQTNRDNFFYNVNQVRWNPISTTPESCTAPGSCFLIGDIAMASFDTPTKNIPTWALLFSALPTPTTAGPAGTGYHVVLDGYGTNGTGTAGSNGGTDFRRRLAENMLGGLASLDEFENFLFGGAANANPQNVYWLDFDDPRRGTAGASPYDFNAWRDNATPATVSRTSQEGITAPGDSGGPLILDNTYAKQVVIAVLSGGYSAFFNGQPSNSYGVASFYQPLYLYWDWIAANNSYHYVSTVAGNGNWTDPTHWVTNADPSYQVLVNNALVNGVPTSLGLGNTDQPGFGEACFQSGGSSDCLNIATGVETYDPTGHPIGTGGDAVGAVANDRGSVSIASLSDGNSSTAVGAASSDGGSQASEGSITTLALPAATLANGLPGATNFVPNNADPVRLTGALGRYFDVTLTATGTTTLNTAVTVDRFAIGVGGGGAALDITSAGSLTSLIDITQATGSIQVNGALISPGDYLMMSGGLNGTGTVTAANFTSVAGTIAPGTAGTIGTLNFRGNVILASANRYMLDLGASGSSDRIAVAANGSGTGVANVGGQLVLNFSPATLRGNNTYTILTAASVTGRFIDPAPFSAILTPKLTYTPTAVTLAVTVGQYGNVIDRTNAVQTAYGMLLDRNRGQAGNYDALYGPLDLQNQATIRSTLQSLAPATETLVESLGTAGVDNWANVIQHRRAEMDSGDMGGTFASYGRPTELAANNLAGMSGMGFGADVRADSATPMVQEAVLPETMSAFVAGGYLKGDSAPMAGIAGRDDYDGWYVAGGIETAADESMLGFAVSYTHLDGASALAGNSATGDLFQGTLYGKLGLGTMFTLDSQVTAGVLSTNTKRSVSLVGTPYTLRSQSGSLVFVGDLGIGADFDLGMLEVTPRAGVRASHIGFSRTVEEGGPMALMIDHGPVDSFQARPSVTLGSSSAMVRPFLTGTFVHEFRDQTAVIGANLVGGVGGNVLFALNGQDRNWGEIAGGLTLNLGSIDLSASAETTIERDDVSAQAYRGSVTIHF